MANLNDLREVKGDISRAAGMMSCVRKLMRLADAVEKWQTAHPGEPLPIQAKPDLLRKAALFLTEPDEMDADSAGAGVDHFICGLKEVRRG